MPGRPGSNSLWFKVRLEKQSKTQLDRSLQVTLRSLLIILRAMERHQSINKEVDKTFALYKDVFAALY